MRCNDLWDQCGIFHYDSATKICTVAKVHHQYFIQRTDNINLAQAVCLAGHYHVQSGDGVAPQDDQIAVYLGAEIQPCSPGKTQIFKT